MAVKSVNWRKIRSPSWVQTILLTVALEFFFFWSGLYCLALCSRLTPKCCYITCWSMLGERGRVIPWILRIYKHTLQICSVLLIEFFMPRTSKCTKQNKLLDSQKFKASRFHNILIEKPWICSLEQHSW